ncbi:MAG: carbon-nitrogen hydrolase family protein [Thermoprotei archaeon]|nr:MAG: carbon-nitrogen hydrolase family protein [Thermoprotei archaeon]
MTELKLTLIQFARRSSPSENLERMLNLLRSSSNTHLIVLPENWYYTGILPIDEYRKLTDRLSEFVEEEGSTLVIGAHYVRDGETAVSRGAVISTGNVWIEYEKHHPSSAVGERSFLRPGDKIALTTVKGVKVGVVVCVDLMYPEVVRGLALRGTELVVNPASIPVDRVKLWRHIGAARAAENTLFLASVNNTSTMYPDSRPVMGGSFVASPEGSIILDAGEEEGAYTVTLDTTWIDAVRRRWSFLLDVKCRRQEFLRRYYLFN